MVSLAVAPAARAECRLPRGAFVERLTAKGTYVAYLPEHAGPGPLKLVVGLYGCGDRARNFAEWAIDPAATRATQTWVGVAVDGASRAGCWDPARDEAKVLAAIDDVLACAPIDPRQVVLAGYSSGGILALTLAVRHAERFAGVLVENSAMDRDGATARVLPRAAWRFPVAWRTHRDDPVFPPRRIHRDLAAFTRAGHPVEHDAVPGDHGGTSADWVWLLAKMLAWRAP